MMTKQRDLFALEERYKQIEAILANNVGAFTPSLAKEFHDIDSLLVLHRQIVLIKEEISLLEELRKYEADFGDREYLDRELSKANNLLEELINHSRHAPKKLESGDSKVILELRPATGGGEASLWAGSLLDMYLRYFSKKSWNVEILNKEINELGGIDNATLALEGEDAYSKLRFEAGGHRVQREPLTESKGRIHTSMAIVIVMKEVKKVEVEIKESDLKISTSTSQGNGGQSVNTTYSKIIITHLPTGLVVQCQDERSQHENKEKAMRVLSSRLLSLQQNQRDLALSTARKKLGGSGERGEKIRTYNFKENRITDHRIQRSWHNLGIVLGGELDEVIAALEESAIEMAI